MTEHQTHDDGGTAISSDFTNLLDGFAHNNGTSASTTITLDGLESAQSYIAQFFIGDEREATLGDITEGRYLNGNYTITGGTNTSDEAFVMPIHSFVGTWVADATTQAFTITNTDSSPRNAFVLLNAAQWREVAVPAPSSDPEITSITSLGGGVFELKLEGEPSTSYEFYSSATLDFTSGTSGTLVAPLTVTLGTGGPLDVTTDGSGDATVEASLGDLATVPANFVRAVKGL